jgi:hypothetical protein
MTRAGAERANLSARRLSWRRSALGRRLLMLRSRLLSLGPFLLTLRARFLLIRARGVPSGTIGTRESGCRHGAREQQ